MHLEKEKAAKKIKAAKNRASARKLTASEQSFKGKHLVFIGPPGSSKMATLNALLQQKNHYYEKAIPVTTRPKKPGEKDKVDCFFTSSANFWTANDRVIAGTEYTLNNALYGTSLKELTRIISDGKHFIVLTSVKGAEILKSIFKNELLIVYFNADRITRAQRLHNEYNAAPNALREIESRLEFGDEQMNLIKEAKFKYITLHHKDSLKPFQAAEFISAKAELANRQHHAALA